MSSMEPGLDRHEWESRWQSLEEDARDAPAEALPELADLVEEMLVEAGYDLTEPVSLEGDELDVIAEYLAARDTADRAERGDAVDPSDIGQALQGLRAVFETIVANRGATRRG